MVVSFQGSHFPSSVILYAVFFYVRCAVSYRDLQEIMAERGVSVHHAALKRWVVKFSPLLAAQAQIRKRPMSKSWRMDETYIKVKGRGHYLCRAVDREGKTIDFMLSRCRNLAFARKLFQRAMASNGVPKRVVIDKNGANLEATRAVSSALKFFGTGSMIQIRQSKYLNNIVEQDHRFIQLPPRLPGSRPHI